MKNKPYAAANALATTVAAIYIICALAIVFLPDLSMIVAQSWFHGLDLSKISSQNVTLSSFVLGLVTATIGAWLVGYAFSLAIKQFSK